MSLRAIAAVEGMWQWVELVSMGSTLPKKDKKDAIPARSAASAALREESGEGTAAAAGPGSSHLLREDMMKSEE